MIDIQTVTNSIKDLFTAKLRTPAKIINALILICSALQRPGLSLITSYGNVLAKLEKKGIPTGPNPDGSKNLTNILVHDILDEVFRALKEDANIQVGLGPGSIVVGGVGGGTNTNIATGGGILQ